MIQPVFTLIAISAAFLTSNAIMGYDQTYAVGYGAFTLMAAMVSLAKVGHCRLAVKSVVVAPFMIYTAVVMACGLMAQINCV